MEKVEENVQVKSSNEGTYHQLALGGQAKRQHVFSPLDSGFAEAVHKDAEAVEYTPEEEVRDAHKTSFHSLKGTVRGKLGEKLIAQYYR